MTATKMFQHVPTPELGEEHDLVKCLRPERNVKNVQNKNSTD